MLCIFDKDEVRSTFEILTMIMTEHSFARGRTHLRLHLAKKIWNFKHHAGISQIMSDGSSGPDIELSPVGGFLPSQFTENMLYFINLKMRISPEEDENTIIQQGLAYPPCKQQKASPQPYPQEQEYSLLFSSLGC